VDSIVSPATVTNTDVPSYGWQNVCRTRHGRHRRATRS
jgi:hypothetical protein